MPRSKVQPAKGPDWPPQQTLKVLKQQLAKLQALKGRNRADADDEESIWQQVTQAAIIHGFGDPSHNLSNYYAARAAGVHNIMGVSEYQRQLNYNQRIKEFEALVLSSIAELEASIPEAEVRGAYDAGDEYAFYKDLKDVMTEAKFDIFVVDNYLDTEFFELYAAAVRPGIGFRVMTDQIRGNVEAVAKKYRASHGLELRSSKDVHDRHIFIDNRCWTVGQSIKDAARKKPTYMVELSDGLISTLRPIYESVWAKASVIV